MSCLAYNPSPWHKAGPMLATWWDLGCTHCSLLLWAFLGTYPVGAKGPLPKTPPAFHH